MEDWDLRLTYIVIDGKGTEEVQQIKIKALTKILCVVIRTYVTCINLQKCD